MTIEKKPRGLKIGKKVRKAIDLLAAGKARTLTEAAEGAGMSREHLSRMLRRPHIALAFETKTRELLASGVLRAGVRLLELMEGPSAHVAFDAARHTLAIGSIKPPDHPSAMISVNFPAGYCIDFSNPRDGQVIDEVGRLRLAERGIIEGHALPEPPARALSALPPTRTASGFHIDTQGDVVSDGDRPVVSRIIKAGGD